MKRKKLYADSCKYKEAEDIKHSINKAKDVFVEVKKKEVKEQHKLEYNNLEENMMLELEDFNKFWDEKMNDFDEKVKQIEKLINDRHIKEFMELEEDMKSYTPKIKPNHEYNVLKMTEVRLKKNDKFLEAEDLKVKCEKIEKQEADTLQQMKNNKFVQKAERLERKHLNELGVAKRKLQDEYNIMVNQREKEYNKLMTKFKTRKIELDLQQKHEKNMNRDLTVIKQSKNFFILFYYFILFDFFLSLENANEKFSIINNSMHNSRIEFNNKLGQSFRNNSSHMG